MRVLCIFAMAFPLIYGGAAAAAPITVTYNFNVGGFTAVSAPPSAIAPVTQIIGNFTTTFEPNFGNGINSSTLDSISLSINGSDYMPSNTQLIVRNAKVDTDTFSGRFEIGGEENGGVYGGGDFSNDFNLFFTDSGGPAGISAENFRYTVASEAGFFDATTFDISRLSVSIPEPAGLSLAFLATTGYFCLRRYQIAA